MRAREVRGTTLSRSGPRRCRSARSGTNSRVELRVPPGITALLFDLDGVLTQTSKVHFAAWKEMFDAFLREHEGPGAA